MAEEALTTPTSNEIPLQKTEEHVSPKSKTLASLESKGDKSYYYWHDKVSKTVPLTPPPLVKVEERAPEEKSFKKIATYGWYDDEKLVKILVEYTKIGATPDVVEPKADDVSCLFNEKSFELQIRNYKNEDHQLRLSLAKEIDHEQSKFVIRNNKIIVTLVKKDPDSTWYSLQD